MLHLQCILVAVHQLLAAAWLDVECPPDGPQRDPSADDAEFDGGIASDASDDEGEGGEGAGDDAAEVEPSFPTGALIAVQPIGMTAEDAEAIRALAHPRLQQRDDRASRLGARIRLGHTVPLHTKTDAVYRQKKGFDLRRCLCTAFGPSPGPGAGEILTVEEALARANRLREEQRQRHP